MAWGNIFNAAIVMTLPIPASRKVKPTGSTIKTRKIRRLGASDDITEPIWFKPKNMQQKTFDRLRKEADHANNLSWLIMGQRLGMLF